MSKVLVAYFSHSGNTRSIAEKIREQLNGDLFEIKTVNEYPVKYNLVVDQAKKEFVAQYKPQLVNSIENFNDYDIIVIGYPMWWYTCPMAIFSFLEQYDFTDKIILPFCTHEGSGLSTSVDDIKKLVSSANVMKGLAIRGSKVEDSDKLIDSWVSEILNESHS